MKRRLVIFVFAGLCASVFGQNPPDCQPQRTPEEIARKQNAMLSRELGLTDNAQLDTLYRMHLKYARLRAASNTRAEDLQRLQDMIKELQSILTPEQFDRFMNHEVQTRPRHPHLLYNQPSDTPRTRPAP